MLLLIERGSSALSLGLSRWCPGKEGQGCLVTAGGGGSPGFPLVLL